MKRKSIKQPRPAFFLIFLVTAGCEENASKITPPAVAASAYGARFNSAHTGSITGQVRWTGPPPVVPIFEGWSNQVIENGPREKQVHLNPNAPLIDGSTGGLGNAVVFLKKIEIECAKPWNHAPARVELRGCQLHVVQGDVDSSIGFVRRGDQINMVSRDSVFHSLHVDGAAFFSLAFPSPDQPLRRPLNTTGLIELTSAAGYYWMRGYLFVSDHPYYCRTDARGHFNLEQVPPGKHEIVCWVPNWAEKRHERDPESGLITRWYFRPPGQKTQTVCLEPGQSQHIDFLMAAEAFAR